MRTIHALVVLFPLIIACRREERPATPAVDPLARVDEALTQFAGTLRKKLGDALKEGGPAHAVNVCATDAPALYAKIRADTGITIGRSSLRLRTPADAAPPWVAEWLKARGERKAAGVEGIREIVDTGSGKVARVLRPIAIEAPCLACHGAEVAPEVAAALAAKYPGDRATGYELGDLRGALYGEVAVTP
jgi:hypothetical protein